MLSTRCMDAFLDWRVVRASPHYDARLVRSCKPGTSEGTDPSGDGHWQEPPYSTLPVAVAREGMQRGYGWIIRDTDLSLVNRSPFPAVSPNLDAPTYAAGTGTQGHTRVRTRYENGTVKSCNPFPVYDGTGSGGCS